MPISQPLTTSLSAKGQISLPISIRQALGWVIGTRLLVESTCEGVLLRPDPVFPETNPEDVFASLSYDGPPRSLEEMEVGILAEAKRRYEGN